MSDRFDALLEEARAALPACVALRRKLHANPELGLELPATQQAVLEALDGLGLEIETEGAPARSSPAWWAEGPARRCCCVRTWMRCR